jgi:hypothetical protein
MSFLPNVHKSNLHRQWMHIMQTLWTLSESYMCCYALHNILLSGRLLHEWILSSRTTILLINLKMIFNVLSIIQFIRLWLSWGLNWVIKFIWDTIYDCWENSWGFGLKSCCLAMMKGWTYCFYFSSVVFIIFNFLFFWVFYFLFFSNFEKIRIMISQFTVLSHIRN